MRIKDVIKNVDRYGRVINAYVVYIDPSGREAYQPIGSEEQYQYFRRMFNEQLKRDEELRRKTPGAYSYVPRANYSVPKEKNTHKNVRISPKVLALVLAGSMALSGAVYALTREAPVFTVLDKIQTESFGRATSEDKYLERNALAFEKAARALQTGDYSECPDLDVSFVKDFISTCYEANVDDILEGGPLNGARYDFNFDTFMPVTDMATFSIVADDAGYETIMKRYRNSVDLKEFNSVPGHQKELEDHLNKVLTLMLQRDKNNQDNFKNLSPLTRIVICEQTKSMLKLARGDYSFFNYNFPQRKQTRDELIEAVDKRENEAVYFLEMQVRNGHSSDFMVGKQR